MAAPQRTNRFPLPRSNLGAVSETPNSAPSPTSADPSNAANDPSAPARGREMRANLLSKLRPPPLVHTWEFWHDRPDPAAAVGTPGTATGPYNFQQQRPPQPMQPPQPQQHYEPILTHLLNIGDIKTFWSLFNNFDFSTLPQHSNVHLFHSTIKPVWEDPRNVHGGSWTFRVPKAAAVDFWQNICLLAIGEQLQEAVASDRTTFRDDICGVSFRPRFSSVLITVWNRDGSHAEGIKRIAETVVNNMPEHLKPKEGSYYYKKHTEHRAFNPEMAKKAAEADAAKHISAPPPTAELQQAESRHEATNNGINDVTREIEKVKLSLEQVEAAGAEMAAKLAEADAFGDKQAMAK